MTHLTAWLKVSALGLGGVGLFLLAFIDGSFLTLPEAADVLIVVLAARHPERLVYYSGMLALGTTLGSLVLFMLARRGGEALLRKRFTGERVERGLRLVRRYGAAGIGVAALMPPPTPFKLLVLLSGALRMRAWAFAAAVGSGRFLRYFGEGLLGVWFGETAFDYVRAHGQQIGAAAALVTVGLITFWVLWRYLRRQAA